MATWSWKGPSGNQSSDWFVTSNWATDSGAAFPQPGDIVTIGSTFPGPTISASDPGGGALNQLTVSLGDNILTTDGTDFGTTFALTTGTAETSSSLLLSAGPVQYVGTLTADGTTTIGLAGSLSAGTFTLTGTITITDRQHLDSSLGQSGTFVNDGSVLVDQRGQLDIESGALGGTGVVNLTTAASAFFVGSVAPAIGWTSSTCRRPQLR